MSGHRHRHEHERRHRHENDPTGNGIVNDGPEKTPHTDPDRADGTTGPDGSDQPGGPDRSGGPDQPGRPDGEHDEAAPGESGALGALGESEKPRKSGEAPEAAPEPELRPGPSSAEAGATAGGGAGPRADGDAVGDDLAGTLTDLFAARRGRSGPGGGPNGTPDRDGSAATGSAATGSGTAGSGTDGFGAGGFSVGGFGADGELDEVALRRMLHGAVGGLEPSDRTLEHLRRAVPARRARRRQATVGAAAAALLIGTAVPAFVHVANSDSTSTASPSIVGHGEQAQGGKGEAPGPEAPGYRTPEPTDQESRAGADEPDPSASTSPDNSEDPGSGTATGGVSAPPSSDFAALRACNPGQLGVVSAAAGAPNAEGKVYGSFRIANVSGTDCTVSSNGTVGVTALGAADPLKINVVQHTAGDAASGLPNPSQEPGTVLLKPSMAYEVQFAWVPADTCPTVAPSPTPTPSPDGSGGSTGEASGPSGTDTQSLRQDGATMDGSIAVTHTPESGAPTAETKINNACSGTIYRTGVLPTAP
ncbi:hypothetical protein GTY66_24110 [Streptomyces sp. SID8356]|uniref:hypothetical protein n=1 Tax=unclassified Streptomyces TaxID=2593676 RepID=UPI000516B4A8|nr:MULTISPECIES: hypothetical protein [unclassified Streptomyces]MYT39093.1 hypothetical protein [Streptomyces sp. SID8356]